MQSEILITGASGLVGRALAERLRGVGAHPRPVPRGPGWVPNLGTCDPDLFRGSEAVVHLAGEPIAARRWSPAQKALIRDSRVRGTQALASALASLPRPPRVLVCASAIGIYGDRGEEELTEDSAPGSGFLADVVRDWEAATEPATRAGIRVVLLRLGVVLSPRGGALAKMLPAFRLGLGGPFGDGRAWMSWIHLDDVVAAFLAALSDDAFRGAYNLTAPRPVTNRAFVSALGAVLHRPAAIPVPRGALRLLLGEMGETLLLHSARVLPARLERDGFRFAHPELFAALRHLLG